ncbi:MAG TPA: TetR/AcrR family transcriptional regulator [Lichenihabitans sp.]|nr:TetR/AcrR family transcriptional regulator [Lichenihabitans sp.]
MTFEDDDLPQDGSLGPQAIVAIAVELAALGGDVDRTVRPSAIPIETSVRQFGHDRPRTLYATARRLHCGAAVIVWQVTFTARRGGDDPVAIVTQTLAVGERVAGPWAIPDDPAEASAESRSETARTEIAPVSVRREQIAAAAADIIARKGFAGASIREIADAAGMHVPTLYQHIASKDELLELVYSRTMAALKTDLDAEVAGYATAEQKLRAAIGILVGRGDRFKHRIGLLNRELKSLSPKARTRVLDQYRDLMGATAAIIRMGMATGEFRGADPDIAANIVDGACDMWALRQFAVGHVGIDAFGAEVAELIIRGLRRPTV